MTYYKVIGSLSRPPINKLCVFIIQWISGKYMNTASHTKCKKCHKLLNLSDLKDISENSSTKEKLVCINNESCEKEQLKNERKKES